MRKCICLYLLLLAALGCGPALAAEPRYDFRIVIDVSGSMKKTDPRNLRVPALKLINGLIPTGSNAGVWTFGRYVDMAVKWGRVDDAWRKRADLGADKIHSNALLTNIESALARAGVGWDKPDAKTRRILLLLTDGKVDISNDAAKNAKSRANVLSKGLAKYKSVGAQIHTIALSRATDEALLKQFALETGGSFAMAQSADELQKMFFKMFERASEPDTVALKRNEFSIDTSIREMTLLIFRKPGSQPTILIPPGKPAISEQKPGGARWRSGEGYDLITLKEPPVGSWRVDGALDPDNRLMVVTDLKLEVNGIPAYSTPREAFRIAAELHNRGKKISKNSFLRFVDFNITHINPDGSESRYALAHTSERKDKGRYLYQMEQTLAEGMHVFVIAADSRTFNRTKRFEMRVQWPVEVKIEPQEAAGVYELKLRAREEYLIPDGMVADVDIEAPDGSHDSLALEAASGWLRTRVETRQDGLYHAHIRISAQSNAKEIIDVDLGRFSMLGVYRATPGVEKEPILAEDNEVEMQDSDTNTVDWKRVGVVFIAINLALLLLLGSGWWFLKRKRKREAEEEPNV